MAHRGCLAGLEHRRCLRRATAPRPQCVRWCGRQPWLEALLVPRLHKSSQIHLLAYVKSHGLYSKLRSAGNTGSYMYGSPRSNGAIHLVPGHHRELKLLALFVRRTSGPRGGQGLGVVTCPGAELVGTGDTSRVSCPRQSMDILRYCTTRIRA